VTLVERASNNMIAEDLTLDMTLVRAEWQKRIHIADSN
jgi:hypothetical protein